MPRHIRLDIAPATGTQQDAAQSGEEKLRPRKRTRSQQRYDRYRAIRDVCPDLKFREFLKQEREVYP